MLKKILFLSACLSFAAVCHAQRSVHDCLPEHTFTDGIEGPATDRHGNVYAVNYRRQGTVGVLTPAGKHRIYAALPGTSVGNGIRFGKKGEMYVADYVHHNIFRITRKGRKVELFAHEPAMNQPNDLALSPVTGYLYASDPDWQAGTGKLWLVKPDGEVLLLAENLGTTNGIEVSPDGKYLYVGESKQLKLWRYDIRDDGSLDGKRLFHSFEGYGMDGMRCDTQGNLYLTRYGKGTVVILSPEGKLLEEIRLKGQQPSNLTFGGKDRKRCYVTLADRGCLEYFDADFPGRE